MGDRIDQYLHQAQDQIDRAIANLREAVKSFEAAKGAGYRHLDVSEVDSLSAAADALEDRRGTAD